MNPNSNKHHWTRGHKTVPDAKREATHAGLSSQRLQRWCQMQFPTPPKKTFRVVPGVIWRIPQRLRFKLEQTRLILTFDGQRAADLSINASRPVRRHARAVRTAHNPLGTTRLADDVSPPYASTPPGHGGPAYVTYLKKPIIQLR